MREIYATAIILATMSGANAADGIDGWGPFKFGMTLEQASAAVAGKGYYMYSTLNYDVEIDGSPWTARAFLSGGHLTSVSIEINGITPWSAASMGICFDALEKLRNDIINKYGVAGV